MTASDKENLHTRKEVLRALEAGEFLKALGYPSERDALEILQYVLGTYETYLTVRMTLGAFIPYMGRR
jgi:hypothetical protein